MDGTEAAHKELNGSGYVCHLSSFAVMVLKTAGEGLIACRVPPKLPADTKLLQQQSKYLTSYLYQGLKEFNLERPVSLKAPKTRLFLWVRRITKLHKMTAMKRKRRPEDERRESRSESPLALRLRMV